MNAVRGRLAPSPTGAQHIGNARTYLLAWLSARSQHGEVRLRIEDIDIWRNKPQAVEQLHRDLAWLGLTTDGPSLLQSSQLDAHSDALQRLRELQLVYPCTCSRADILNAASAPHVGHEEPVYPGTCAHRRAEEASDLTQPYAWRFRVTHSPEFTDLFAGYTTVDLQRVGGDFVVWRSANVPAYQLAVAVDDDAAGITEVVRGDDLLSSTPRQLLIAEALGLGSPKYAHVPLVVGVDGRRLAKRHGDTRLVALAEAGVAPEALLGLIAWSCGWIDRVKPIAARELVPLFRWGSLPRQPWVLQPEQLHAIGYVEPIPTGAATRPCPS